MKKGSFAQSFSSDQILIKKIKIKNFNLKLKMWKYIFTICLFVAFAKSQDDTLRKFEKVN